MSVRSLAAGALGGRLWRHGDFLWLWSGQTVNMLGTQITMLALPTLAINSFGATPFQVGLLRSVQFLPFLLLGVLVGAWLDRRRRRPVMVLAHLGRVAILASIPVAFLSGHLALPLLFAVAVAAGACNVLFVIAYQATLPDLVPRGDLVEGNAKLQMSMSAANVAGPSLAGLLIDTVGAALAIAFDALSFLLATLSVLAIRRPETAPEPRRRQGRLAELAGGVRVIARHPVLRRTIPMSTFVNTGAYLTYSILLVFAYRDLGLTPGLVGLAYSAGGAGWLAGALLVRPLARSLGPSRTMALSTCLAGTGLMGFGLARLGHPLLVLTAAQVLVCVFWPVFSATESSVRQSVVPGRLQGRAAGVARTLMLGVAPLAGSLAGGLVAGRVAVLPAVVLGGAVCVAGVIWTVPSAVMDHALAQEPSRS